MLIRTFCSALLAVTLWSATAQADIIPDGVWSRPIDMYVEGMPSGMVLMLVDSSGRLESELRDPTRRFRVTGEGTIYWGWKKRLSKEFYFKVDQKNLHPLKTVAAGEVPKGVGWLPSKTWSCTMVKKGENYEMSCVDQKGNKVP